MWRLWRRKFSKPKIINFILRNNRTYKILFQKNELFVDDSLTWMRENEKMESKIPYLIKFIGTSPQDFRRRIKKGTFGDRRKIPK